MSVAGISLSTARKSRSQSDLRALEVLASPADHCTRNAVVGPDRGHGKPIPAAQLSAALQVVMSRPTAKSVLDEARSPKLTLAASR